MKANMILKLSFFMLFVSVLAYNVSCSTKENSNSNLNLDANQSVSNTLPDSCRATQQMVNGAYQISNSCAITAIDNYQKTIIQVKDSLAEYTTIDTSLIVKGAYVNMKELQRVLDYADLKYGSTDSLFIMLAIIEDKTHLVFTLQNDEPIQTATNTSTYNPTRNTLYFDFTIPCPSTCPR